MIADYAFPEHAYAEYNAWMSDQTLHHFVGTVQKIHDLDDGVDNRVACSGIPAFRSHSLERSVADR